MPELAPKVHAIHRSVTIVKDFKRTKYNAPVIRATLTSEIGVEDMLFVPNASRRWIAVWFNAIS